MSTEQPNPFSSPVPVVHGRSSKSRLAVWAFAVCGSLPIGMFIAQLIVRPHLTSYGFELPNLVYVMMSPFYACLPMLCCPLVLASRSWKNNWNRLLVCALSILFAILHAEFFCLQMVVVNAAIQNKLGP